MSTSTVSTSTVVYAEGIPRIVGDPRSVPGADTTPDPAGDVDAAIERARASATAREQARKRGHASPPPPEPEPEPPAPVVRPRIPPAIQAVIDHAAGLAGEPYSDATCAERLGRTKAAVTQARKEAIRRGWWPEGVVRHTRRPGRPPASTRPTPSLAPAPASEPVQEHVSRSPAPSAPAVVPVAIASQPADCLAVATAVVRALKPLGPSERLSVLDFVREVLA